MIKGIVTGFLAIIVIVVAVFGGIYFTRFQTIGTIERLTDDDSAVQLFGNK